MTAPVTPLLRPVSELVACAWLGSLPGLNAGMVATQLPRDVTTWQANGFVTVTVLSGGADIDTPLRSPVLAVDCWALVPGSSKPPWFQAAQLAELIVAGCHARNQRRWVPLPARYAPARVSTAYCDEPRRVYGDPAGNARYSMNLTLNWSASVSP